MLISSLPSSVPLSSSYRTTSKSSHLLSPMTIRATQLSNRVVVSPMCMYSSHDGYFNAWHLAHLSQWAIRGAGLIFTEATGVAPNGRITPKCCGIWSDDHIAGLRAIAEVVHSQGSKLGVQLAHAGRKASCYSPNSVHSNGDHNVSASELDGGWPADVVAPSAVQGWPTACTPREASQEDVNRLIEAFGDAARRCDLAGVDVIEIHGAHGYLINSFLSPLTNLRTDKYGQDRALFLLQIVERVRAYWPLDKPLFIRLSCSDQAVGGITIADTVQLCARLKKAGVDLIDCSSGGLVPIQPHAPVVHNYEPGWNLPFSQAIKEGVTGLLTGCVGGITDPLFAESILKDAKADLVFIGRAFLRQPAWVVDAAEALGVEVTYPTQYKRAKPAKF